MRKFALIALAAAGVTLLALFVGRLAPSSGNASSHREAPLISEDPTADNDRPVRVPQPGQAGHADDHRQLDPRRGSRGGAELLHVLPGRQREVPDLHRPQRRRKARR